MAGKTSGIEDILKRWRLEIKQKQRRIISFEETVEIKINALKAAIFAETEPLTGWEYRQFKYTRHRERKFIDKDWRPIEVGQHWGGPDMSAMFRCKAKMPRRFAGQKVALKIYFGGDGLINVNGKPFHGLDPFRDTVILTDKAKGNETYDFDAEAYIMWHFGESEIKTFESSHFAVMDQELNDIYWDFRAAYNVMIAPNQEPLLLEFLKAGMAKAIEPLDQNEKSPKKFFENARRARAILRKEIYQTDRFKKDGLVHLCGNSHLDIVFLWTHAEFVRKLGRTHASTLRLMEQYPDYVFSQSQPVMYEEMKQNFPSMYQEMKKRVKEGRWEVIGGSWVEPDCNLISGESFVRQILYGVQFIEQEFGITPHTYWCPDVFGNSWAMPQIIAKCGMKYFVTHKMVVWNDTNPWKKNTFWWQGMDGTKVLALVPPTHFIGTVEPDHMAEHWRNFSDKKNIGESLYNYGWGDGGGGPDPEMLEYLKRYKDFPGVTPTKAGKIEDALDSIARKAQDADLPIWNDELYLEEHRGTFTTKARLKKLNRRCENLYREAEIFSCFSGGIYPQADLTSGWKTVLLNQFHDSLPGSHIPPVYLDLQEAYATAVGTGKKTLTTALNGIVAKIDTRGDGDAIVVFNSLGQPRNTIVQVEYPEKAIHVLDASGAELPHQFITHYETGKRTLVFSAPHLPAAGYKTFHLAKGKGKTFPTVKVTKSLLENAFVKVRFNNEGQIIELLDKKTGRQCIDPAKKGNVFQLYEDVPGKYEAWDIAPSYTNVEFDISGATVTVVEEGPVRSAIEVRRNFRSSRLIQRIVLGHDSPRIDFETWIDWHEQQKLLKTRFHTTINSRLATYDIAYGNIQRSAYRNHSYDEAKFEVPAHQWMDLSQGDYGLSLLNDCKYGHEAFGQMMALTLLRGPISPDPMSDQEEHWFTYSLYPHDLSWREAGTVAKALDLNNPAVACVTKPRAGNWPATNSFVEVMGDGITLEAVKKAEKSSDLIIRLVERHGASGDVAVKFSRKIASAGEVNLLEREESPASWKNHTLSFFVKPYEIRTFRVKLAK